MFKKLLKLFKKPQPQVKETIVYLNTDISIGFGGGDS